MDVLGVCLQISYIHHKASLTGSPLAIMTHSLLAGGHQHMHVEGQMA